MNALIAFLKSRDGLVAIAALVLLGIVSHFSDPYNPWINLLARVGNLCIFLYILWRAGGAKALASLSGRRASIAQELESLAQRKKAAEEALTNLQQRLASLETEREAILEESRMQAEAMKVAILQNAQNEAEKIREQAQRAAESDARSCALTLRERMADDIVGALEASLHAQLSAAEHDKLIDTSLQKVVLN